jgi:lipopolysaccharide/colanic/teichoic acid biosynthesis glycosyltransferase
LRSRLAFKRSFDVLVALAGLLITLPALLLIALLVRLDSSGPALFWQKRIGAGGRTFKIAKFRTMVVDAEQILESDPHLRRNFEESHFKLSVDLDPRVTRLGRFLRLTSLDELPQLWNVLRGEMSLVGPRPVPENHFDAFGAAQVDYIAMRPGLTGYWQVTGRNSAGDTMVERNRFYVSNWSLRLDLSIMFRTLPTVLARRGVH